MAARPISSATISFGLVSIPVKLYSSGDSSTGVHFNLVHKKCGSRLKQQYVCPKDNETVGRDQMAKGYEFSKDQFVLFTDEEIKKLQEKSTYSIQITEFVPIMKVDSIYFDNSYYLGPDKGGDRAYKLLSKALQKSGYAALAKYAARGKQYLVMVRPMGGGLLLQQLKYADEVRPISEVPMGDAVIKDAELKLALQIIEQGIAKEFKPDQYEDDVRKRVIKAIEEKVDGQEITFAPEEPQAQVIDLMEALKSSLARGGERKPARRSPSQPDTARASRGGKAAKRGSKSKG